MPTIHTADHESSLIIQQAAIENEASSRYLYMRVKTNHMQQEGMYPGDTLLIDRYAASTNGCILVLNFDGKLVLRKLIMGQASLMLQPLHGLTQTIEWPSYQPLPLVGVVKQIIRTM
jgi:SOS-response transcriptional repressor LexA